MSDTVIIVEDLSKRYRIGMVEARHDTLTGTVLAWVKQPARNLRNLRRLARFDEADSPDVVWALKDVSFAVQQGEVVGIVGRNGAGKSTLLKILSQITEPTRGEARIRGRVASLLEVGTGFHPELTGRENVYLNGTILGMRKAEIDRKFAEIVEFSGITDYLDTPVKRYSSGMRVRLAFSVAAHLDPEVLLIDEVLAVGDAEFQRKCLGKMSNVAQSGRTVLFVSHNMAAVRVLCGRTVYLERGQVVEVGPTAEVINSYLASAGGIGEVRRREGYNRSAPIIIEQAALQRLEYLPNGRTQVEIALTCYAEEVMPFTVEWILTTMMGQQLAYGSPQHLQHESLLSPVGRFNIRLVVRDMPLAIGRYYFDFRLSNLPTRQVYDSFEQAVVFDVETFDPYQKGRGYRGRFGSFHFPDEFVITQSLELEPALP